MAGIGFMTIAAWGGHKCGERRTANGERRTANGERRTANGERRTADV
jgi:rare lipoprotein A (peptidoglycan hydrolase)